MKKTKSEVWRWFLVAVVLCVAFLTFVQTANFPFVPFTDAICFLPQAVKFAQGDGLRNVYQFHYLPDGAYVWHGFLMPMVLGGLFKTDTYIKVTFALALLNSTNILLLAAALFRLTTRWSEISRFLLITLCLLVQAGFLQGVLGRPETLVSMFISAGLLAWSCKPGFVVYTALGGLIGLLAVTSPAPGVYAAGCLGIGLLVREDRPLAILKIGGIMLVAGLFAIFLSFCFYPYNLEQWIWGLQQHAKAVVPDSAPALAPNLILRRFFISTGRFAMGLVFICAWAISLQFVWQLRKTRQGICYLLCVGLLLIGFALFRMAYMGHFYYMLCLFPIAAASASSLLELRGDSLRRVMLTFMFAALGLSSLDPILLQSGRFLGYSSLQLPEARRLFEQDFKEMLGKIAVSMDLAALSDETERLQVLYDYVPPCKEPDADWLVIQQHCFFYSAPPTFTNFKLVKNRFAQVQKLPGRLSQWFGVNGYGYAIYRRVFDG